jgi:hypothetical protein
MIGYVLALALLSAAPSTSWTDMSKSHAGSTSSALPSFLGVQVGESSGAVDTRFGYPDNVKTVGDGEFRRYVLAEKGASAMVKIHDDRVVLVSANLTPGGVSAIKDPYGVTLSSPAATVQKIRGAPIATMNDGSLMYDAAPAGHWFYRIENGMVTEIALTISYEALGLMKADDTVGDGSTQDRAIVITAANESDGIQAEHDYIAAHPCASGGQWQWTKQALLTSPNSHSFDQIDVKCSTSGETRSYYFDITSFLGHL